MRGREHFQDAIKAEPNLVPLLDLTFQLIMFFMICVNFVSEQVNQDIKLPVSQSARAMDKGEVDVLFLNLQQDGKLVIPGRGQPLQTRGEALAYLQQQYQDARRLAQQRGGPAGKVVTAVILRADRNALYEHVFGLLQMCKNVGFHKSQLRAYTTSGG